MSDATRLLDGVTSVGALDAVDAGAYAAALAGELPGAESAAELEALDGRFAAALRALDEFAGRAMKVRLEAALATDTSIGAPTRKVFATTIVGYAGKLDLLAERVRSVAERGGSRDPGELADRVVGAARKTLELRDALAEPVLALIAERAGALVAMADGRARDRRTDVAVRKKWSALRRELEAVEARPVRVLGPYAERLAEHPEQIDEPIEPEINHADLIELGLMADRAKALFAAVYADPAADGPRSVLADHLQEQGDPRGEFIALQLAKLSRKPTAAATRRERALLAEHQAAWLGTLVGVVNEPNSTWARGFLDTVTAELSDDTPADPSWNTVRTIRIVGGFPPKTKVLGAGCFRALTDVASVALDHVGDVLDAKRKPPQIEALAIYGPRVEPGKAWDRRQLKLVERLVELPRLSRLALRISRNPWTGRDLDWLWATAIARRVTHLQVGMDLPFDLAGCLPGIATLDNLESFAMAHNYFTFRLTRDGDRAWSQLVVEWDGMTNAAGPLSHVARVIRELPPDTLTTFRFDHPTARWSTRALAVVTNAVARQTRIKRKR